MAKVRFNLRNKKDKTTPIYLIYSVNGQRLVYPLKERIHPNHWNDKKMEVKYSANKKKAVKINAKIQLLKNLVFECETELLRKGVQPCKHNLIEYLDKKLGRVTLDEPHSPPSQSFEKYIDWFIAQRKVDPNFRTGTVKRYTVFRNHWLKYRRGKYTPFEMIKPKLLKGYIKYLTTHDNNYSDNHVHAMVKIAKVILNDACEFGILYDRPQKSRLFRHAERPADNIYLTPEELSRIDDVKLSYDSKIGMHRDLFLIGAFTGLRFSDFTRILPENIVEICTPMGDTINVIKIFMKKVNDYVFIPIHPIVAKVLAFHDYNLKKYSVVNQVINRDLKVIGKLAGINQTVTKIIYRNNVGTKKQHKKYELITTHTARRSFATNAYKSGIPAISIMKITGHKTQKSFMKYICIEEEENASLLASNPFFNK